METKNDKKDICADFLDRVNDFSNVPKEVLSNPMRVQMDYSDKVIKAVQPHNYRLYYDFTKVRYNPTEPYSPKNYGSEHHFEYPTHRIVVRKQSIEVQYLGHQKQWRRIIADSEEQISLKIDELELEFNDKCFTYLKQFIKKNGGKSSFKLIRKRDQDWGIHGDKYLDKIPDHLIITDTVFKKVYRDKVEFKGPNEVKNYITNRALERFSPEISNNLKEINENIGNVNSIAEAIQDHTKMMFPLRGLKRIVKCVDDVINNSHLVRLLNQKQIEELEKWIFLNCSSRNKGSLYSTSDGSKN